VNESKCMQEERNKTYTPQWMIGCAKVFAWEGPDIPPLQNFSTIRI